MTVLILLALCASALAAPLDIGGLAAEVSASGELASSKDPGAYDVDKLFDGDLGTAWSEAGAGTGEGEWVQLTFAEPTGLLGLAFVPGYAKDAGVFEKNSVPVRMHLELDGTALPAFDVSYRSTYDMGTEEDPAAKRPMGCYHAGASLDHAWRLVAFAEERTATTVRIVIDEGQMGSKWHDMLISELRILGSKAPPEGIPGRVLQTAELVLEQQDGKSPASLFGASVSVGGTDEGRAEADFMRRMGPDFEAPAPLVEAGDVASKSGSQAQRWWGDQRPQLYGQALAVGADRAVGPVSDSHGDGEWVELYPVIGFDSAGKVAALTEVAHMDGAPGCRGVIP